MTSIEAAARLNKQIQICAMAALVDQDSAIHQRKLAHRTLDEVLDAAAAEVAAGKKLGREGAQVDTAETVTSVLNNNRKKEIGDA